MRPRRTAVVAAASLVLGLATAHAQTLSADDEYPRDSLDPPLALPQQLNGVILGSSGAGEVRRLDRIRDVFLAMRACWRPPRFEGGPTGQQVTVRMSFRRSGEIIGKPQITYFKPGGGRGDQERFTDSVVAALARCRALPFTEELGSAIAGRPFTFRFVDDRST